MQEPDTLDENNAVVSETEVKPGFWQRQFLDNVSTPQLVFDIAFGIVFPILCFVFDPIVFNGEFRNLSLAPDISAYKFLVYIFSSFAILTLSLWLFLGRRSGSLSGVIAGVLLSGSLFCLLIGVLILPLTLLGLLLIIGVLGFIPFLTSFVYLRNSIRALNSAKVYSRQPTVLASLLLGACLIISPALLAHWQINRIIKQSMNDLMSGDIRRAEAAGQKLRYFEWAIDSDQIVWSYYKETDQTRKDALAKAYNAMTGKDVQARLAILLD
jgi:hypothetical protein